MENKQLNGMKFFKGDAEKWENVADGISRQMVGYNTQLMMVKVKFETGAIGYVHDHFHSQSTYVASGIFNISINGKSEILKEGDGFFVQPNTEHGAECLEEGVLIDVFNPFRDDFLQ